VASLNTDYKAFLVETDRLLSLSRSLTGIQTEHRKLIAEIILIRLSILLETHLKLVISKLACGVRYLDGSAPMNLVVQSSMASAVKAMTTLNRKKPRYPIWNDGKEIRENIVHLVDATDHCMKVLINYAPLLTEVRYVRNHIAHRNDGTRKNFRAIVQKYYGAYVSTVTCGILLLSERASIPSLLESHILATRVMLKDLTRA
jgi:hypothetical protein